MDSVKNSNSFGQSNTAQAFWVAAGSLSSFALAMVSAAVLSRYFDKTEYGTYRQILYIYSSLLIIFSAGLPRVFAYFLPRHTIEEGKYIVKQITQVLFLAGMLFSAFLFFGSGLIAQFLNNEELEYGLRIFSPIPMLLLPTLGIEGIFSTYKKSMYIAIYNTVSRLIMLAFILVPVLYFGGTYIYAIYGWLAASVLMLFMALWFKNIPFKGIVSQSSSLTYKEIFGYSLPLVFASIWGIAIKTADEFYISRYFGADTFAEFSNGFTELPFVTMITASTSVVLMPLFSKLFKEGGKIEELITTWRSALKKSAILIYPLVIYFLVFSTDIMVFLYSDKYEVSGSYFKIKLLFNFFNIVVFAPLFLANGKTKLYAYVHMYLAIFLWASDYALILLFDSPYAIAINSIFLAVAKILIFVYLSARFIKVPVLRFFPLKTLVKLLIHGSIIIALVKLFDIYIYHVDILLLHLTITFSLFSLLLVISARFFRLNYLEIFIPFINKVIKKK
ncbi:Membrane protein involved in the export of O-antigen and teichoic acid [Nonlabens sp. Hel1_33_55]|uniref:oligosaccharide flippase family protein n=1 Tax=Nonlabens sp. Hel1_33_55 TaxID=1336802 RepID=UPI000875BA5E|nr:oligosaccharide flippase family protein [Nonlabens sp. Hel1_33_55]SCX94134.1 Membrane protein involved in the export of O-antigen and teichoic acid [Nonlabens sp. Hel1_33_55]